MKTREQLQDEYEDALFALLMYDIAQIEGQRAEAENERLRNDPNAKVPEELDQKCLRTIRRCFLKKKLLRLAKWAGLFVVILLAGGLLISLYILYAP